jgi:hypothetical protein
MQAYTKECVKLKIMNNKNYHEKRTTPWYIVTSVLDHIIYETKFLIQLFLYSISHITVTISLTLKAFLLFVTSSVITLLVSCSLKE